MLFYILQERLEHAQANKFVRAFNHNSKRAAKDDREVSNSKHMIQFCNHFAHGSVPNCSALRRHVMSGDWQ